MSLAAVSKSPLVLIEAGAKVKSIWPPTSSDIKPIDFATCSILESDSSPISYSSVSHLKEFLTTLWPN